MGEAAHHGDHAAPAPVARVVADVREPDDLVAMLRAQDIHVEVRVLAPADFIVGELAIERKSVGDLHASLIDKRLFEQVARIKDTYGRCALLLEGDLSFFSERKHPRAIWGALASLAIGWGVAVLPVPDKEGSAQMLGVLAKRALRERGAAPPEVRFRPRATTLGARQRFAVQGLPMIGDVTSGAMLEHFGSVRRVFAADERDLLRVPGVGKGRAAEIARFLDAAYEGRQRRLKTDDA
ncbi:MAG: hypothetical protein QOE90_75 [Thermoplasmata archaeon]|jgi:Fanconi anemia group M protein|nr:hypothetical protein [Thermoplasmata archaeon]